MAAEPPETPVVIVPWQISIFAFGVIANYTESFVVGCTRELKLNIVSPERRAT